MAKVKVKFLKHVLNWKPGDVAEVEDEVAKQLCKKTKVDLGGGEFGVHRKALPLDEAEKLQSVKLDVSKVTQHELEQHLQKNVVVTPLDPLFEAKLKKIREDVPNGEKKNSEEENDEKDQKRKKA